jgi:hypothetical protein
MSYLCLKRDIKDGEYGVFDAMGESYIIKNDKQKLTLARNKCKHRGFKVADCAGRGSIKCKYHGQRFEFEGRLAHHEFGEFVFTPEYLGRSDFLAKISSEIGEEFGSHTQEVNAPFHLWMQNTADPNHLFTAHKDSFSKLFDNARPENVYISEYESSYTMRIKDEAVERYAKHFGEVSDSFTHYLGFPNLSVTSFLGVFYSVESAVPNMVGGSRITTRFFIKRGIKPNLLAKLALEANVKILQEDKELVEHWAKGYKYDPQTKWLPGEERIKRYADEIRARGLE